MTSAGQFGPYPFIDSRGNALPGVELRVYDPTGTTLASLYVDSDRSSALTNPIPTGVADGVPGVDTAGNAIFYADAGEYLMVVRYRGSERYRAPITISADPADANAVLSVNGRSGIVIGLAEQTALTQEATDRATADGQLATAITQAITTAEAFAVQRGNHTGSQLASTISDLTEAVQDIAGALVVAGANVTVTYNDGAGTLTIAVSGLTEAVQDIVGALGFGGAGLTATYDDAANTLVLDINVDGSSIEISADTLRVKAAGITNAMLAGSIDQAKITNLVSDLAGKQASGTSVQYAEHGSTVGLLSLDGSDLVVDVSSNWGIDSSDEVYYDAAGATSGEEALLSIDPFNGALTWVRVADVQIAEPEAETVTGAQAKADAAEAAAAVTTAAAITTLKGGVGAGGDTLSELDARIAVVEALGSLATDAELVAAVAALIGSADTAGDTLGELQALIGLRLLKSANLSDVANAATALSNLGGQPLDSDLTAIAALVSAANKLPYATGAGTWSLTDLTAFARTLLVAADAATARATLDVPRAAINGIVSNSESDTSISNDATEQTLATRVTPTSPALAAGDRLILRCSGELTNNTGGAVTYTFRVKLGGTTIATSLALSEGQNAASRKWYLQVEIALSSVTAQIVGGFMIVTQVSSATMPLGLGTGGGIGAIASTAAEDLAVAKNVVVTVQMGTADPNASCVKHMASLERIAKVA